MWTGPHTSRVLWPERKAGARSWRASKARLEGLVFLLRAGVSQNDIEWKRLEAGAEGPAGLGYNFMEDNQAQVGSRPSSRMGPGLEASGPLWALPCPWPGPWSSDPQCHSWDGATSPGPQCWRVWGCGWAGGRVQRDGSPQLSVDSQPSQSEPHGVLDGPGQCDSEVDLAEQMPKNSQERGEE